MTLKECYATLCGNYDEALSRLMNERLMERFLQKFLSDPSFNEIKDAIESAFNVKVSDIRTLNTKAKDKRVGRYTGKTKTYKKAIVTLADGYAIEI